MKNWTHRATRIWNWENKKRRDQSLPVMWLQFVSLPMKEAAGQQSNVLQNIVAYNSFASKVPKRTIVVVNHLSISASYTSTSSHRPRRAMFPRPDRLYCCVDRESSGISTGLTILEGSVCYIRHVITYVAEMYQVYKGPLVLYQCNNKIPFATCTTALRSPMSWTLSLALNNDACRGL